MEENQSKPNPSVNTPLQCKRMPIHLKYIYIYIYLYIICYNSFVFCNVSKSIFRQTLIPIALSRWATYNYQPFMHCAVIGCRHLTKWIHTHKEKGSDFRVVVPPSPPELSSSVVS